MRGISRLKQRDIDIRWGPGRHTAGDNTFSYFVTPNVAVELILTVPQEQTVYSNGTEIGTFKHLPPTLTAQYHFTGMAFRPYVGAGVNYNVGSKVYLTTEYRHFFKNSWADQGDAVTAGVGMKF